VDVVVLDDATVFCNGAQFSFFAAASFRVRLDVVVMISFFGCLADASFPVSEENEYLSDVSITSLSVSFFYLSHYRLTIQLFDHR
jgi:hypothetical protein